MCSLSLLHNPAGAGACAFEIQTNWGGFDGSTKPLADISLMVLPVSLCSYLRRTEMNHKHQNRNFTCQMSRPSSCGDSLFWFIDYRRWNCKNRLFFCTRTYLSHARRQFLTSFNSSLHCFLSQVLHQHIHRRAGLLFQQRRLLVQPPSWRHFLHQWQRMGGGQWTHRALASASHCVALCAVQ